MFCKSLNEECSFFISNCLTASRNLDLGDPVLNPGHLKSKRFLLESFPQNTPPFGKLYLYVFAKPLHGQDVTWSIFKWVQLVCIQSFPSARLALPVEEPSLPYYLHIARSRGGFMLFPVFELWSLIPFPLTITIMLCVPPNLICMFYGLIHISTLCS